MSTQAGFRVTRNTRREVYSREKGVIPTPSNNSELEGERAAGPPPEERWPRSHKLVVDATCPHYLPWGHGHHQNTTTLTTTKDIRQFETKYAMPSSWAAKQPETGRGTKPEETTKKEPKERVTDEAKSTLHVINKVTRGAFLALPHTLIACIWPTGRIIHCVMTGWTLQEILLENSETIKLTGRDRDFGRGQ